MKDVRYFVLGKNHYKNQSAMDVTLDTTGAAALTQYDGKPVGTEFVLYRATIEEVEAFQIQHVKITKPNE